MFWGPRVRDVSLDVAEGEIFGIAGLVGSGRSDLLKCVFGVHRPDSGTVKVFGQAVPSGQTRAAVDLGLGLIPEERQSEGLFLDLSIERNLSLAALGRLSSFGVIDRSAEREQAARVAREAQIQMASLDQATRELSGGNQQKVVFGRWMQADSRILLLDEPSRGVDLGARGALHRLLRDLIESPKAAVVVSSDFDELLMLCDRIAVMASGTLIETRDASDWSREALLAAALERAA